MENDKLPDEQDVAGANSMLVMKQDEFQAAFGESINRTLDINTWDAGEDLAAMYEALQQEVALAVEQEGRVRERVRAELFPLVFQNPTAPACAGHYQVDVATIERIHRGLLFNGGV